MMDDAGTERIELDAYQLNNIGRTWFGQWNDGRADDAPLAS